MVERREPTFNCVDCIFRSEQVKDNTSGKVIFDCLWLPPQRVETTEPRSGRKAIVWHRTRVKPTGTACGQHINRHTGERYEDVWDQFIALSRSQRNGSASPVPTTSQDAGSNGRGIDDVDSMRRE